MRDIKSTLSSLKNPASRILVFVQTVANGLKLADKLECDFYRGTKDKTLTNQEREEIAKRWYEGHFKIMVATDAFGPGNDYPSVRYVYMVGAPRGVVDFVQMAGRAGRDGHIAFIHLYHLKLERFWEAVEKTKDHLGQQDFSVVLGNPLGRCWREIFSKFLDGSGEKCEENAYNWPCPACSRNMESTVPAPWVPTQTP